MSPKIKKNSRNQYLTKLRKSRIFRPFAVKNLYARILAKVQRKQGLGKKKFMV
jgi:hypothetical protein